MHWLKNPFEEDLLKVIWCLKQHMPKHKPVTPSNGSHPNHQSLDYQLMLHVDTLVVLCTSMVAYFWRLQLSRNLRYTSSSVSQFTRSISPQRCWKAKLTPLKQSFGSLWIITHHWGGSVRGLNQSASDTARATVAGVNGGSENSVRWAEDRGLTALFVFFWAVYFVWCYLEKVYFQGFDWWFGLLRLIFCCCVTGCMTLSDDCCVCALVNVTLWFSIYIPQMFN